MITLDLREGGNGCEMGRGWCSRKIVGFEGGRLFGLRAAGRWITFFRIDPFS